VIQYDPAPHIDTPSILPLQEILTSDKCVSPHCIQTHVSVLRGHPIMSARHQKDIHQRKSRFLVMIKVLVSVQKETPQGLIKGESISKRKIIREMKPRMRTQKMTRNHLASIHPPWNVSILCTVIECHRHLGERFSVFIVC